MATLFVAHQMIPRAMSVIGLVLLAMGISAPASGTPSLLREFLPSRRHRLHRSLSRTLSPTRARRLMRRRLVSRL